MTRCSAASLERDEPLVATASVVERFLLIEDPGPWGPHVLQSARLSGPVRARLRRAARERGLRTLLIRRPVIPHATRPPEHSRAVFLVDARQATTHATTVHDLMELVDLDLAGPSTGSGNGGWAPHPHPIVLVCTHGKHDPCCAELGRPLAAAVARAHPDLTWEASHIGGDRFAGNLVVLPRGDYFGRLDPTSGPATVERYLAGDLDLEHHRGRSTQSWVVQAAEAQARHAFGATRIDDFTVTTVTRHEDRHVVELVVRGERVTATVAVDHRDPARLTCHAETDQPAPRYWVELARRD